MGQGVPRTSAAERRLLDSIVDAYLALRPHFELFRDQLMPALAHSAALTPHVHSLRSRLKDPEHLRDKLLRKLVDTKKSRAGFTVKPANVARRINDLLGVRVLHLYTRQIRPIDEALRKVFDEGKFDLLEGPFARTWDDESRGFFRECGITTRKSPSMYTSVHYVIGSASRTRLTAEIQVRTLSEEVWGEVDHSMNYPHASEVLACREQLKVLARVTSSATRLVDSIFVTLADHSGKAKKAEVPASERRARKVVRRSPK